MWERSTGPSRPMDDDSNGKEGDDGGMNNSFASVQTCDEGEVNIHLIPGSSIDQSGYVVEVVGKVNNDLSVQEQVSSKFGTEYDAKAYQRMLDITSQFPDIF
ncbi:hypothetical protein HK101_007160 [Irineochytrium annulatum]|nr:hypothetical protein HK101_007160 [Irineochytrium annulatum]